MPTVIVQTVTASYGDAPPVNAVAVVQIRQNFRTGPIRADQVRDTAEK